MNSQVNLAKFASGHFENLHEALYMKEIDIVQKWPRPSSSLKKCFIIV